MDDASQSDEPPGKRVRADAQRSIDALIEAAKAVFAEAGVDAPVRQIADRAGVGIGTLYRNFPERSDLVIAVFRREVDACATAAVTLAAEHPPGEALRLWLYRFAEFIATKRGLGPALYSGNPAFGSLRGYFRQHLLPALETLLQAAIASGEVRADIAPGDLLTAISALRSATFGAGAEQMLGILIDGLRPTDAD